MGRRTRSCRVPGFHSQYRTVALTQPQPQPQHTSGLFLPRWVPGVYTVDTDTHMQANHSKQHEKGILKYNASGAHTCNLMHVRRECWDLWTPALPQPLQRNKAERVEQSAQYPPLAPTRETEARAHLYVRTHILHQSWASSKIIIR